MGTTAGSGLGRGDPEDIDTCDRDKGLFMSGVESQPLVSGEVKSNLSHLLRARGGLIARYQELETLGLNNSSPGVFPRFRDAFKVTEGVSILSTFVPDLLQELQREDAIEKNVGITGRACPVRNAA